MPSFDTHVTTVVRTQPLTEYEGDLLIVPAFTEDSNNADDEDAVVEKSNFKMSGCLKTIDEAYGGAFSSTLAEEKFSASLGKFRIFKARPSDGLKSRWLMILGLSAKTTVKFSRLDRLIQAYQKAFSAAYGFNNLNKITVCLGDSENLPPFTLEQWTYAAIQGAYKSTYKTAEADVKKIHDLKELIILTPETVDNQVLTRAIATAKAEALTKDLANQPANLKSSQALVDAADSAKKYTGVTLKVESDPKVLSETMPAFWAVGQASKDVDPPRFIKLEYRSSDATHHSPKIALVGKGVVFDTGGAQVKPDKYMNDMKFDMTGAASVLSVVKACAELQLKNIVVTAYVAAARNLIGETCYLPDSIINTASGKKIEVRHTDAEGRITLADSLWKATQDKPDKIITIATLTGAAAAAVGACTALMGSCEDLKKEVLDAFREVGELAQKCDFIEEDYENVKSTLDAADVRNTSKGTGRGHLTAGAFVLNFANNIPIVHLDIAGGDAKDNMATGIAVKGLLRFVEKIATQ